MQPMNQSGSTSSGEETAGKRHPGGKKRPIYKPGDEPREETEERAKYGQASARWILLQQSMG
jgi:hypothetical protein